MENNSLISNVSQNLSEHVDNCNEINILLSNKFTELFAFIDLYNLLSLRAEEKNRYILELIELIRGMLHDTDIDPETLKSLVKEQQEKISNIKDELNELGNKLENGLENGLEISSPNNYQHPPNLPKSSLEQMYNHSENLYNPLNNKFEKLYAENPKRFDYNLNNSLENNSNKSKKKLKKYSQNNLIRMQNLLKLHNTGQWNKSGLKKHHKQLSNKKIQKNINKSRNILKNHGMGFNFTPLNIPQKTPGSKLLKI
jgi:hypothetical protein